MKQMETQRRVELQGILSRGYYKVKLFCLLESTRKKFIEYSFWLNEI